MPNIVSALELVTPLLQVAHVAHYTLCCERMGAYELGLNGV